MGKKAMYTKLVENKDEDGNVYYGETVLGDGGFGKTASSSTSKCKLTCCKVLIFTLLFSVVLSGEYDNDVNKDVIVSHHHHICFTTMHYILT